MLTAPAAVIGALPSSVDLRAKCPPVYDQGRIGSCTANALAAALQFCELAEGLPSVQPSRLFIYWNERYAEGTVDRDAGAVIRDGVKVVNKVGCCSEAKWTYDDTPADPQTGIWSTRAKPRKKPVLGAFKSANECGSVAYLAIAPQVDQLRACLAQGFPFIFGFKVYASFESADVAKTGIVNLPTPSEQCLGGHAVLAVGYDDATQRFIVRNSWGSAWGQAGYFTIPYAYLASALLASDFWSIRKV
jgi:C1A family cysteine protease